MKRALWNANTAFHKAFFYYEVMLMKDCVDAAVKILYAVKCIL